MTYTPTIDPRYYAQVVSYKNSFGTYAITAVPTHSAISGNTNINTSVSLLIPTNLNQPIEIPTLYVFPRATITAGALYLLVDDGTTVHLVDNIAYAAQTLNTTTAGSRIQFTNFSATSPLVVQPGETVYLSSTIAQSTVFDGVAIGGIY